MSIKQLRYDDYKVDLDTDTCPKREDSIGTVKTYAGNASELIGQKRCGEPLPYIDRQFAQTSMCPMSQVVSRLFTIQGSVLIAHGAIGCAQDAYSYQEVMRTAPPDLFPDGIELNFLSSNLTEQDVVFGGEKKLRLAIETAVERYNPKCILIANSCAAGVMGDDIEGIASSMQPNIEARIIPIHCEGFRSGISATGFDAASHAIVKYLVQPPKRKQTDLVAIPAPLSVVGADRIELSRLLSKVGLRALFVPDFATAQELIELSEVAVVAPTCASYGYYLQSALHEKYGVPYFREPAPLGIEQTSSWLRQIAKYTGKKAEIEQLIEEEKEYVLPRLEEIKKQIKDENGSIFVSAGLARAVFIPKFAAEMGLKVVGISSTELDAFVLDEFEELYEEIGDFKVHGGDFQAYEQTNVLDRLKPDLVTGCVFMGLFKREASTVRNHSYRSDFSTFSNTFGYRGMLNYGYVILRSLENPSLNKIMKERTPRPYRDLVFEDANPLKYTTKEKEVV
jgi:nitrogenase molybdenum-iron protein alpha chain